MAEQNTPVEVQKVQEQQSTEPKADDWSNMIVDNVAVPSEPKVTQTNFYKQKYDESDWVLMFHNPTTDLKTWMVKDLLESIDVKARGIRLGRTGKCYADFEDEETWNRVKALSGKVVDNIEISVDDVPPRVEAPNKNFNKGKHADGQKKPNKFDGKPGKKPFNKEGGKEMKEFKKDGKFTKKTTKKTFKGPKTEKDWENVRKGKDVENGDSKELIPIEKKAVHQQKKVDDKKKTVKKVKQEVVLNEEEVEEGWEVVKKGVKSDGKKKKSGNGRIDGIIDRKNAFE